MDRRPSRNLAPIVVLVAIAIAVAFHILVDAVPPAVAAE
jgi:hypothetical protein